MKFRPASLFVTALLAALIVPIARPAKAADDIDFSRVSCNAFLTDNKDDAVLLLTWLEGYFSVKSGAPIMYGDKAREHARDIRDYCFNHSSADLFSAARKVILGK